MEAKSIIVFTVIITLTQGLPQNTLAPELIPKTTTIATNDPVVSIPTTTTPATKKNSENPVTTVKTEVRIQTLPNDDPKQTETKVENPLNPRKSGKKELDNPSKIIDMHKTNKSHEVSGRKGVDPSQDVATEMSTDDHVNDLNSLKNSVVTTTPPVTTVKTTVAAAVTTKTPQKVVTTSAKSTSSASTVPKTDKPNMKTKEPVVNDTTPRTSLLVGIVFGCLLLSVLMFVGFKRLDAIRRRREYRRMNDFLIDGMYNEM